MPNLLMSQPIDRKDGKFVIVITYNDELEYLFFNDYDDAWEVHKKLDPIFKDISGWYVVKDKKE